MIPCFDIRSKTETGSLLVHFLEEEWQFHEDMTAINTILLLKLTQHLGEPLNETTIEKMRTRCCSILDRFVRKDMIYYNPNIRKWNIPRNMPHKNALSPHHPIF